MQTALHAWLLDRLESYFDLDGRMQDLTQRRKDAKGEKLAAIARSGRRRRRLCVARAPRAERESDQQQRDEASDDEQPAALARLLPLDARRRGRGTLQFRAARGGT